MIQRHKIYGLSIPEVLVSLGLIAISTLSVILTVAHAMAISKAASKQHAAWRLASELSAWMHARGHQALGKQPEDLPELSLEQASSSDCYAVACTAREAAYVFLLDWRRRLQERLPGARLVICRDTQPWDEKGGKWRWSCRQTGPSPVGLWLKLGWPLAGQSEVFSPGIAMMQPEIE